MDRCTICEKPVKFRKAYHLSREYPELLCMEIKTTHHDCQRAYDKVEKLKRELVSAEFELFLINHKY